MKAVNLFLAAGALALATPAFAGGSHHHHYHHYTHSHPHTHTYAHAHKVKRHNHRHCCHHRKTLRVETSIARAGLGGDSTLRANQDNRSPLDVIYIYRTR